MSMNCKKIGTYNFSLTSLWKETVKLYVLSKFIPKIPREGKIYNNERNDRIKETESKKEKVRKIERRK